MTAPAAPTLEPQTEERLLEEFEAERPGRRLTGVADTVVNVLGAGLSLFAVYWVLNPITGPAVPARVPRRRPAADLPRLPRARPAEPRRAPEPRARRRSTGRSGIIALVAVGYAAVNAEELFRRAADPERARHRRRRHLHLLVLEATRRTVGWILPAICAAFLAYAYLGGLIPESFGIAHKGYGVDRIVGQAYMGLEGLFGIPLDVAATYIVLFTLYGAVLEYSGAARFFVQLSYAAFGGSRTGPGRTTTLAGFLLGTVSGSGVATTVTLGSVTWPLLRKAGYPKDAGGGVLAAAGIGAILSPPTLGAAAFIIAEFLEESYFKVLLYAIVPSLLYYLGDPAGDRGRRPALPGQRPGARHPGFWRLLAAGATTSRR